MTVQNTFKEIPAELTFVRDYLHLNLGFQDNMNIPISKHNQNNLDIEKENKENEYENKLYNLMNNNDQIENEFMGGNYNNMNESSLNYSNNNVSQSENKSYMKMNKSIVVDKNNNGNNNNNNSLTNSLYLNDSSIVNEPLKNSYYESKLDKINTNTNNIINVDNKKITEENDVDYSVSKALNNKANISGLNLDDVWDHSILTEESKEENELYNSKII